MVHNSSIQRKYLFFLLVGIFLKCKIVLEKPQALSSLSLQYSFEGSVSAPYAFHD